MESNGIAFNPGETLADDQATFEDKMASIKAWGRCTTPNLLDGSAVFGGELEVGGRLAMASGCLTATGL